MDEGSPRLGMAGKVPGVVAGTWAGVGLPMRLFRYRAPSWRTLLGLTRLKKEVKKDLGITEVMKPFRWYGNEKRKLKLEMGYESEEGKLLRDGLPTPLGVHGEGHHPKRGKIKGGISFFVFVVMEIVQVLMFDHHHDHRKKSRHGK